MHQDREDVDQPQPAEIVQVVQHNHQAVTMFDGSNGLSFTMAFQNFATHQNFWDIVNGNRLRPADGQRGQREWDRANASALNALRSWISPRILHLYLYSPADTARAVWERIERQTDREGAQARRSVARNRLQQHYQQAGEPLEEWLAELNSRFMNLEMTGFVGMDDGFRKETLLQQVHPMHKPIAEQIDLQQPQALYGEFFNCLLDRVGTRNRPDDVQSQGYAAFRPNAQRFQRQQRPRSFSRGRTEERKHTNLGSGAPTPRGTSKPKKFAGKCHNCHKIGNTRLQTPEESGIQGQA